MTNKEIVMKLIGNVMPIGDTTYDSQAFKNLQQLSSLVEDLNEVIFEVASGCRGYHEKSIKLAQEHAEQWLIHRANDTRVRLDIKCLKCYD